MPQVSVIIPCFNGGEFLPRALNSLDAQTYRDFEVIVVDDGSTDPRTLALLASLPPQIRILRQENRGLAAARNAGCGAATGRYLLPLDCDDWISPDFLERATAELGRHDASAFVFSDLELHGERSGLLHKAYNAFEQLFLNQLPYCLLMHRQMWATLGGYDEAMVDGYEDWEFNIRAAKHGFHGVRVEGPLFNYWVSSAGMLHSRSRRRHLQLWLYIQRKHPDLYAFSHLLRGWSEWRNRIAAYPAGFYGLLLIAQWCLPAQAFNAAFSALFRNFGASQTIQTRGQISNLVRTVILSMVSPGRKKAASHSAVDQRLVDAVWATLLISNVVMVPIRNAETVLLNIVAYDFVGPLLLGFLAWRGYLGARTAGPVLTAIGLSALVMLHSAALWWLGDVPRPLLLLRETLKLCEAILMTSLLLGLFRTPEFLRPSRSLLLLVMLAMPFWAAVVRTVKAIHIVEFPETVLASSATGICVVWFLTANNISRERLRTAVVTLALIATAYILNSKTFLLVGLVVAAAPFIVSYFTHANPSRLKVGTGLAVAAIFAAVAAMLLLYLKSHDPTREWLGSMQSVGSSWDIRRQIWMTGWQDIVRTFPRGLGLGQFRTELSGGSVLLYVHNTPLGLLTELGLLGGALFIFAGWLFVQSLRTFAVVPRVIASVALVLPMMAHDVQSFRMFHVMAAVIIAGGALPRIQSSGIALSIGSAVFSRLAIYGTLIVAARLLRPDEFGAFAVAMTFVAIVTAFVSGGGDLWLNRFARAKDLRRGIAPASWAVYLRVATALAAILSVLAILASLVGAPIGVHGPLLAMTVIGASIAGIAESCLAIIRASGRVTLFFLLRDLTVPLLFLLLVVALHVDTALAIIWIYSLVWLGALLVVVGYFAVNMSGMLPVARRRYRLLKPAVTHTLGLIYGNFGSRLGASLDTIVLSALIPLAEVGAYRMVAQFSLGFIVLQHFLFLGLPWQLGRSARGSLSDTGLKEAARRQRLLIGLSIAAVMILISGRHWFLSLIGPQFVEFSNVFCLLMVLRFSEILWGPQHEILVSHGRVLLDAHANVVAVAAWALAFLVLSPLVPYVAAAVPAVGIASLAGQGARHYMIRSGRLPSLFGHPFGPALPVLATAAVIAASFAWL